MKVTLEEIKKELRELYSLKDENFIHVNDAADYAENLQSAIAPDVTSVDQSDELLPCPFCGGEGQYFCWDKPEGERYDIACEDCPGRSPIYETMEDAKKFWNKRATQ